MSNTISNVKTISRTTHNGNYAIEVTSVNGDVRYVHLNKGTILKMREQGGVYELEYQEGVPASAYTGQAYKRKLDYEDVEYNGTNQTEFFISSEDNKTWVMKGIGDIVIRDTRTAEIEISLMNTGAYIKLERVNGLDTIRMVKI